MKKITLIVLMLASGLAFAQTKETREVGTFSKLSFRVPGKLILKQGQQMLTTTLELFIGIRAITLML